MITAEEKGGVLIYVFLITLIMPGPTLMIAGDLIGRRDRKQQTATLDSRVHNLFAGNVTTQTRHEKVGK